MTEIFQQSALPPTDYCRGLRRVNTMSKEMRDIFSEIELKLLSRIKYNKYKYACPHLFKKQTNPNLI